jgi:hypothetical protein
MLDVRFSLRVGRDLGLYREAEDVASERNLKIIR